MEVMSREAKAVAMSNMLQSIAEQLVDEPNEVTVVIARCDGAIVLNLTVAAGDVGKVIGKQGRTARSLRTILGGVARKYAVTAELNIEELG